MNKRRVVGYVVLFSVAAFGVTCMSCQAIRREAVKLATPTYSSPGVASADGSAAISGSDVKREQLAVKLSEVAKGFAQPTDIHFVPTEPRVLVVLEKEGAAYAVNLDGEQRNKLITLDVTTPSEMGLLGIAFHPKFAENGRLFLNFTTEKKGKGDISRVQEFTVPKGESLLTAKFAPGKILYEVEQPYPNHNAGQLQFGPDGFLYIGWGDGGYRADPHNHGQDLKTALGSMLRIDVDGEEDGKPYRVPKDNPFLGKSGVLPETWAYGLRNPWRYSFDQKGRLIVADVGQDLWEEIHVLKAGDNAGWNTREGRHCFEPKEGCKTEGLNEPIYEYPRDDGRSITGGYVYLGEKFPELKGQYVFADFLTGRFWAIPIPDEVTPTMPMVTATALGQFSVLPSAFARDANGELYVADFGGGTVLLLK